MFLFWGVYVRVRMFVCVHVIYSMFMYLCPSVCLCLHVGVCVLLFVGFCSCVYICPSVCVDMCFLCESMYTCAMGACLFLWLLG